MSTSAGQMMPVFDLGHLFMPYLPQEVQDKITLASLDDAAISTGHMPCNYYLYMALEHASASYHTAQGVLRATNYHLDMLSERIMTAGKNLYEHTAHDEYPNHLDSKQRLWRDRYRVRTQCMMCAMDANNLLDIEKGKRHVEQAQVAIKRVLMAKEKHEMRMKEMKEKRAKARKARKANKLANGKK